MTSKWKRNWEIKKRKSKYRCPAPPQGNNGKMKRQATSIKKMVDNYEVLLSDIVIYILISIVIITIFVIYLTDYLVKG